MKSVVQWMILFFRGEAEFLRIAALPSNPFIMLLLICPLLLQSCAVKSTSTSLVPYKELSRNSMGYKETVNKLSLNEVNPYTVYLRRQICESELIAITYQARHETRHATHTLDCSDEYVNYVAHNLTALGVPLLYDSVTGFNLIRQQCRKNPPVYQIVTAESNEVIKEENLDSKTAVCKEVPVADVLITAKVNDEVIGITTSATGIASLPAQKVSEIKSAATNSSINFQYDSVEITTVYVQQLAQ